MDFITKWVSELVETAIRKVLAEDQFKALVAETVTAQVGNLDYQKLAEELHERDGIDYRELAKHVDEAEIAQNIDTGDIESKVIEMIDTDSIADSVAENIDTDDIAERVKDNVEIDYSEIEIDYQALGRALVDLAATRR